jgi:transposase
MSGDRPSYDELLAVMAAKDRRIAELERRLAELEKLLAERTRTGKRQAAPFSKGPPKAEPKQPGRKAGTAHGRHGHRPPPEQVDETLEAPLPESCPQCGAPADFDPEPDVEQFQTEIHHTPIRRRFVIRRGRCRRCGAKVRGRHPLQTSDAVGAAASQFGAGVHAAIAVLQKECGLSHGKVASVLRTMFGIDAVRASACRAMLRTAKACRAAEQQIKHAVATAAELVPDETGWRVGGRLAWLHVAVAPGPQGATAYAIDRNRGFDGMRLLIPPNFAGRLAHDGFTAYANFGWAIHQQCTTHLLRRCRVLLETATRGAVRFPRALQKLLQSGLALRDRFRAGMIIRATLERGRRRLEQALERLVYRAKTHVGNERLAAFVWKHLDAIFAYLRTPGAAATNALAEQALRPAVVNRKVWGGNRTWAGAAAQATLCSVLRTLRQRGHDPFAFLVAARRAPAPLRLPEPGR